MNDYPKIILASASPRRAELLDQMRVNYSIQVADIDETSHDNETPEALVQRLAVEKSQALSPELRFDLPVLGADTLGVLDGELLVKPINYEHAEHMLSSMSGRWHEILSAVALASFLISLLNSPHALRVIISTTP